ncbi:MAG: UMP kinase [Candidatus Daviesbacteria bacterium]|nr:UMP kinase [Candidatus Daviesbacteria bacterium]
MANDKLSYDRVMLKISGELFGDDEGHGINFSAFEKIAQDIINIREKTKVELALVVGGGNIFRGRYKSEQVDEATADYMGMMATVINGMGLQEALERLGAPTRMMTAIEIKAVAEPYIRRKALRHLTKGRIVIFTAGTGNPFFTTDSGAALRAAELNCDVILKATNVDGVYTEDPNKNPDAKLLTNITYQEAIEKNLEVMDATAFALCKRQNIPIIVFNIDKLNDLDQILTGHNFGTLVSEN